MSRWDVARARCVGAEGRGRRVVVDGAAAAVVWLVIAVGAPGTSSAASPSAANPAAPAGPNETFPSRAEVAAAFSCPPGTVRAGAAPPAGFEEWCEKPDEPPVRRRQGPALRWYDDGSLAQSAAFTLGELDGRFLEWHRNGRLARAGVWQRNERVGTWIVWYESGRREEECGYERSTRQGRFATWWPDGKRRVEGRFCHDLQCGTWISWDEQGHEQGRMTYEEIRRTP